MVAWIPQTSRKKVLVARIDKNTFIASPKTITHRRVDSNAAYVSTPNDKRSDNAISHTVAMDVDVAADE